MSLWWVLQEVMVTNRGICLRPCTVWHQWLCITSVLLSFLFFVFPFPYHSTWYNRHGWLGVKNQLSIRFILFSNAFVVHSLLSPFFFFFQQVAVLEANPKTRKRSLTTATKFVKCKVCKCRWLGSPWVCTSDLSAADSKHSCQPSRISQESPGFWNLSRNPRS